MRYLIALLFLSISLQAQPQRSWVSRVGPRASRPLLCDKGDVWICVGPDCTTQGEYDYCYASNLWRTQVGGVDGPVGGASTIPGNGELLKGTAPGQAGPSDLSCATGGVCTLFNATGPNTLVVKAGSAQGATDLFQAKNAAGANVAYIGSTGSVIGLAYSSEDGPNQSQLAGNYLYMGSAFKIKWSATTGLATTDLSLYRKTSTPGVLRVGDGSTGYGSVEANNLTAVALATPAAPTVTPTCAKTPSVAKVEKKKP